MYLSIKTVEPLLIGPLVSVTEAFGFTVIFGKLNFDDIMMKCVLYLIVIQVNLFTSTITWFTVV